MESPIWLLKIKVELLSPDAAGGFTVHLWDQGEVAIPERVFFEINEALKDLTPMDEDVVIHIKNREKEWN
jgi:hypothetical protein